MTPELLKPPSKWALFSGFTIMALQGFGGVQAVVYRELVERKRWLSQQGFVESWAVAQTLPGPNVVNLGVMVGARHFGPWGSVCAVAGLMLAPFVLVLFLAAAYEGMSNVPQVQAALRGMGFVVPGLILANAIKLWRAQKRKPMGRFISGSCLVAGFVMVGIWRVPLALTLLLLGLPMCCWAWRCLGAEAQST